MNNKKTAEILLGFDFGLKRIGVAIGQTITGTARPLTTLRAKNGVPEWHLVKTLIQKWGANTLIVGIPLNMDGTPQPISIEARRFAETLRQQFALPVFEMDERLTTKSAKEQLFNEGGFKALQDGQIDQVAAQLILQNWFNENKN